MALSVTDDPSEAVENSLEIAWRLDVGVSNRDLTLNLGRAKLEKLSMV